MATVTSKDLEPHPHSPDPVKATTPVTSPSSKTAQPDKLEFTSSETKTLDGGSTMYVVRNLHEWTADPFSGQRVSIDGTVRLVQAIKHFGYNDPIRVGDNIGLIVSAVDGAKATAPTPSMENLHKTPVKP